MFNREKHQLIMGQILKDIYTDVSVSPLLGFKGGTCAYFFYKLPRFSVDLDFDLLEITDENKKIVFEKVVAILSKYGRIKDQHIKRFTVFVLLSYGDEDHNIKVEINIRKLAENMKNLYEMKEYLGISMFFAKKRWNINIEVVKNLTGKSVKEYLPNCIAFIEKIKDSQMLQGLGELIESEKQKDWIRNHLKADAVFMLKNYQSIFKI